MALDSSFANAPPPTPTISMPLRCHVKVQDLCSKECTLFTNVEATCTVGTLRDRMHDWCASVVGCDSTNFSRAVFLFCSDGVALDKDESVLAEVFPKLFEASSAEIHTARVYIISVDMVHTVVHNTRANVVSHSAPPTCSPVAPVAEGEAAPGAACHPQKKLGSELLKSARQHSIFRGQTSNFMATGYPRYSAGVAQTDKNIIMQSDDAMSAACSTLYVFTDCCDARRDKIVAGLVRSATTQLSTGTPFALALKMLCCKAPLFPSQKAAIMTGLLAAMRALYPKLAADAPARLLEATPFAFSWLLNAEAAEIVTSPRLSFIKFVEEVLEDFEDNQGAPPVDGGGGDGGGVRPCEVRGHPEMGILDTAVAAGWVKAMGLPMSTLEVTNACPQTSLP